MTVRGMVIVAVLMTASSVAAAGPSSAAAPATAPAGRSLTDLLPSVGTPAGASGLIS